MVKRQLVYWLVSAAVLALSIVPVGTAVFVLGFGAGDSPCVMCWEERIGMLLIALLGLFVLRYGPRPKYVGLAVLVAAWGLFMGLRHTALHAARDIGQGFSLEILGAHTYTWAVVIYWIAVIMMGLLLMLTREEELAGGVRSLRGLEKVAVLVFLVVAAANVVQAFASTGPPPFLGQSDPVRFSFDPRNWVWSTEEWRPSPVSLRGRWAAGKPDLAPLDPNPDHGPFAGLPRLAITAEARGPAALAGGQPTGLAYDETTGRFAIATEHGIHVVDSSFSRVLRHTVVDPGFSVDLGRFSDIAFLDARTVMAIGENKSYVVLRESDRADARRNYRFFLESFDRFDEVSRSRFSTVRARMMYTLSLASDRRTESLYSVTVPNEKSHRLVVSRFDRRDMTLSEEFLPSVGAGLALVPRRSIDDLYVTAVTAGDDLLYALSAAYGTLIVIDPAKRSIVAAYTLPGLAHPVGLARKGTNLIVLCRDSRVVTFAAPRVAASTSGPERAARGE